MIMSNAKKIVCQVAKVTLWEDMSYTSTWQAERSFLEERTRKYETQENVKASKGAKRKIAAVEGEGGAEPNQKPFSDAQKTKLTKVTERLVAIDKKMGT